MNLSHKELAEVKKKVHYRVWEDTYKGSADFVEVFRAFRQIV